MYSPKTGNGCYNRAVMVKPCDVRGRRAVSRATHLRAGGIRESQNRWRFQQKHRTVDSVLGIGTCRNKFKFLNGKLEVTGVRIHFQSLTSNSKQINT